MHRRVADFGLFLIWRPGFGGTSAAPPNSPWRTMRTGAWPRRRSKLVSGAAGSWRRIRRTMATAGTGTAAIPQAVDRAVRSAFGGPHVAMLKARHQNGRESACAHGDTGAGIQLPGDATSLGPFLRPPIAQRRRCPKIRLYAIVHKR
jgi:hypothetical protein